jgi:hypothetical protein
MMGGVMLSEQQQQQVEVHKANQQKRRGTARVCPKAGEFLVLISDADTDDTEVLEVYRVLKTFDSREVGRRYAKNAPPGIVDDCELDDGNFMHWIEDRGLVEPVRSPFWVANVGSYSCLGYGAFDPGEEEG